MEAADGQVAQPDPGIVGQSMGSGDDAKGFLHGSEEADGHDEGSDPGKMEERRV